MEDAVTEPPPPSRFFQEDLDSFAPRSPPLPSPFLLLNPQNPNPNNPIIVIAISSPSLSLLRSVPDKTLIGTLFLPEKSLSISSAPVEIHSSGSETILVSVPCRVGPERSRAVAKALLGGLPRGRVLVLDSIRAENYRGRLSADEDEAAVFKLETKEERKGGGLVGGVGYLGSGSMVDGFGAAVMAECEMRRGKGTMVVAWPEEGREVAKVLSGVLRGLGLAVDVGGGGSGGGFLKTKSDLYL
ncbi:uncharacterized protein M6B38_155785 [Iris pallida]|uniref:Proteasome assembly chaperone 1 n=1 Tax=Iris pallida TaxID=29817 RepID=A0AAX6F5A8_IRIPA|nr:uncharacterized protein M6B38_155785 [Iris pallida]